MALRLIRLGDFRVRVRADMRAIIRSASWRSSRSPLAGPGAALTAPAGHRPSRFRNVRHRVRAGPGIVSRALHVGARVVAEVRERPPVEASPGFTRATRDALPWP